MTLIVFNGIVVAPGVKPGIFDVACVVGTVVVVDVDEVEVAAASGSSITFGDSLGLLITLTDNAYSGSVISITI